MLPMLQDLMEFVPQAEFDAGDDLYSDDEAPPPTKVQQAKRSAAETAMASAAAPTDGKRARVG